YPFHLVKPVKKFFQMKSVTLLHLKEFLYRLYKMKWIERLFSTGPTGVSVTGPTGATGTPGTDGVTGPTG
ncbi:hypothetical protein ABE44_00655, partial [Bacillus thuringiensis]|nr:hypothetical protein [Bacillus thuringiensis]